MFGFVLTTAFVNLFMGSASAKWAIMAPVFVPMFMLLGYTPELTQAAYRVGDSVVERHLADDVLLRADRRLLRALRQRRRASAP